MISSSPKKEKRNKNSDRELFLQISKGEIKALDILFERHYNSLCKFGQLFENDFSIVEEKISDVFLMLWEKHEKLDQIKNPKPYLYVIVRNSLKKRRKQDTPLYYLEDREANTLQYHPSTEDKVIYQEQQEKTKETLSRVLNDMPVQSKRIFEMCRVENLTYKEISEILEISPKTVESHMGIALKYFSMKIRNLNL